MTSINGDPSAAVPPSISALIPGMSLVLQPNSDVRRDIYEGVLRTATGLLRVTKLVIKQGGVVLGRHFHYHPNYSCDEQFFLVDGEVVLRTQNPSGGEVREAHFAGPAFFVVPAGIAHEVTPHGPAVLVSITTWLYCDQGPDANTHRYEIPAAA